MSVSLLLYLFGKPGQELDEGGEVTPEQLRALGKDLRARLEQTADVVEKLTGAGWDAQMELYDICLTHPYLNTASAVEEKLRDLGIDPEHVCIHEWPDEDEEEIEEEPEME